MLSKKSFHLRAWLCRGRATMCCRPATRFERKSELHAPASDLLNHVPDQPVEVAVEFGVQVVGVDERRPAEAAGDADRDGRAAGKAAAVPPVAVLVHCPALGVAGIGGGG